MADETQQLLFAKQLADNAEYANETGLRNLLKIIETGSPRVVEGPPAVAGLPHFPSAFDALKELVEKRPDLFSDALLQEFEDRVKPRKLQRATVGSCEKCNRQLRMRTSWVEAGTRLTCKCGHINVIRETRRLAAPEPMTEGEIYAQQAASYVLKFLKRPARCTKPQPLAHPAVSVRKRFLAWLRGSDHNISPP